MDKDLLNLPISFTKKEDFKIRDTRFIPVEIDLLHLGENFNNSVFSKESVINAIPTLANTPILAYMEKDEKDEDDFSDHRREYEDGIFEYQGVAIGVIGENNNARFVTKVDTEGVGREHLVVDGLIWTKWNTPLEIFDKREGQVAQSMELHEDCSGFVDEETGLFHFTDFKFFGACALGKDIQPAMAGSSIKVDFSMEDFTKEVQAKMEEFKDFQLKIKEGEKLDKKLEILKRFSKTKEEVSEIDLETVSEYELEKRLTEMADDEDDAKAKKKLKEEEDIKKKIEEDKRKEEEEKKKNLAKDEEEEKKKKKKKDDEDEDEDEDEEDDKKKKKLFADLESELEIKKEEYSKLKEEVESLREFKQNTLTERRQSDEAELFAKYEMLETVKEFETLKEKSADFSSISELEKEIALIFATESMNANKSRNFSKEDSGTDLNNKFNFEKEDGKKSAYGGLFDKFSN